jgi:hypothetical protein
MFRTEKKTRKESKNTRLREERRKRAKELC